MIRKCLLLMGLALTAGCTVFLGEHVGLDPTPVGSRLFFSEIQGQRLIIWSSTDRRGSPVAVFKLPRASTTRSVVAESPRSTLILVEEARRLHKVLDLAVLRLSAEQGGKLALDVVWRGKPGIRAFRLVPNRKDPDRILLYGQIDAHVLRENELIPVPRPERCFNSISGAAIFGDRVAVSYGNWGFVVHAPADGSENQTMVVHRQEGEIGYSSAIGFDDGWAAYDFLSPGRGSFLRLYDMEGEAIASLGLPRLKSATYGWWFARFGEGVLAYTETKPDAPEARALVISQGRRYWIDIPTGVQIVDSFAGRRALIWDWRRGRAWWFDIPPPPEGDPEA